MEGVNGRLMFAIAAATLGSAFQHGYNTGVINVPQSVIEQFINDTYTEEKPSKSALVFLFSLMVSMFCLGGMIGPIFTSILSENLGRKRALLFNNIFVIAAAALMGLAKMADNYKMLLLGRFFIGVNSGLNSSLVPMYLSEICPVTVRGAVGTVYTLVLVISILSSQILGLPKIFGNEELWPILFGLIIFPTMFMLLTLPICPESPKFLLIIKEDPDSAKKALQWLRGTTDVGNEIKIIEGEHEEMKKQPKMTYLEFSKDAILRRALTMAVVMMLAQQFSGINAVIHYSTKILTSSGLPEQNAVYATLVMGIINVLMTIVSMFLVDMVGRKPLLMVGMTGMMVISVILTISMVLTRKWNWMSYISMVDIAAFVIMFAAGLGSIPWFLVAELFEQAPRPLATSIAVSVNWFANFLVSVGFLPLADLFGIYVFLVFTVALAGFLIFTYREIPETKNRTTEEITQEIRDKCIK